VREREKKDIEKVKKGKRINKISGRGWKSEKGNIRGKI